jgi:hypothetical protein
MQDNVTFSKKSGKGISHGVVSELTAYFGIQPGHEEELRAACRRFGTVLREADPEVHQKPGLRDLKFVIFDNGQRLMLMTTFETDWDAYIPEAVTFIGVENWIDWMQHTTEVDQLRASLRGGDGAERSGKASKAELEQVVKLSSGELQQVLQSAQVQAVSYFNDLADLTVPQIKKAMRVEQAFQRVLDNPEAAQALQHSALKPLLEQAAD